MISVAFADTHVGQRPNNEDWYRVCPNLGLYVVADGMGGYAGGELASRIAVGALDWFYRDGDTDEELLADNRMGQAFRLANVEVRRQRQGALAKMGSTLSALVVRNGRALIGHVGDSRVYRCRAGRLEQLTSDHSLIASMKAAGLSNMLISSRFGHIITRAIGVSDDTDPDIITETALPGDRFLLCTDGLTDVLDDETIGALLCSNPAAEAATALVEEALRCGGEDNITAVVVEIRPAIEAHHQASAVAC
jgi:PPM family protein phosphatase